MSEFSQKAMLVRLKISIWRATKIDREVTDNVIFENSAQPKSGKFRKILTASQTLKEIRQLETRIRTLSNIETLPWGDASLRILPVGNYQRYDRIMKKAVDKFNSLVEKLLGEYDAIIEDGKVLLGKMFKAEDYPPRATLHSKFAIGYNVYPLPNAEDFKVELDAGELEKIREQMKIHVQESIVDAVTDLWKRLHEAIDTLTKALDPANKKKKTGEGYKKILSHIHDVVAIIPHLNLTQNEELENLRLQAQAKIVRFTEEDLESNPKSREELRSDMNNLLRRIYYYGGFKKE